MEFRRSGGRDERRRRVLMDEPTTSADAAADSTATAAATSGEAAATRPTAEYADAAAADRQVRLSDLVPHRAALVSLYALLALLMAGGAAAAAWYAPAWQWLDDSARSMLSPAERGSLASWLASMLLLLSAGGAIQIYLLRRHKINDYRGRYRLWIWMAVLCLLGSADAVTGAHELLGAATRGLLPAAWTPAPLLAWMLPLAAILGAVGVRLAIEVRQSYGTCTALGVTGLCYLASAIAIVQPQWLAATGAADTHATATVALACQLGGHVFLLLTTMLYGRYVFLAANGMLAVRPPRVRREKKPKKVKPAKESKESNEEPAGASSRKTSSRKPAGTKVPAEAPTTLKLAPKASISKAASSTPAASSSERAAAENLSLEELADQDDLSDEDTAHLSKAERRRLKKLQRRSNRAA